MCYTILAYCECNYTVLHRFDQRLRTVGEAPLALTECEEMMLDLQEKYPIEYKTYGLSSVAVAIVFPLIKNQLEVCFIGIYWCMALYLLLC